MRTVVLGKKIEHYYNVEYNMDIVDGKGAFKAKPELVDKEVIDGWEELCSFEGDPRYNSSYYSWFAVTDSFKTINISEDETVKIEKEIFRADLNELHLHTDKVVEEQDMNKEALEELYNKAIKDFNRQMIESNETLKAYCDLHKMPYEDTDCEELFKVVFPGEKYEIVDGEMRKVECKYGQVATISHSDITSRNINISKLYCLSN